MKAACVSIIHGRYPAIRPVGGKDCPTAARNQRNDQRRGKKEEEQRSVTAVIWGEDKEYRRRNKTEHQNANAFDQELTKQNTGA